MVWVCSSVQSGKNGGYPAVLGSSDKFSLYIQPVNMISKIVPANAVRVGGNALQCKAAFG